MFSTLKNSVITSLFGLLLFAQTGHAETPKFIAIIIDDIGYGVTPAKRLANLPYPLTFAILPNAAYSKQAATILDQADKELILHLPMQGRLDQAKERYVLHERLSMSTYTQRIRQMMDTIPNIIGANNHQGSILTQNKQRMNALMEEIKQIDQFYFVDSLTSGRSIAWKQALQHNIPTAKRDVFIDHERSPDFINKQLNFLLFTANKHGFALGIGHPYPETIRALEQFLPTLGENNIKIIPVSEYIQKHPLLTDEGNQP